MSACLLVSCMWSAIHHCPFCLSSDATVETIALVVMSNRSRPSQYKPANPTDQQVDQSWKQEPNRPKVTQL